MQVQSVMKALVSLLVAAVSAALIATPAWAQWKWRDAGGRMQYSDRPPPVGVPDKDILQRPPTGTPTAPPTRDPLTGPTLAASAAAAGGVAGIPAAAAASAVTAGASKPSGTDPVLEAKRRDAERADAARRKQEADKLAASRADNCERARSYLRTLDDGMRISRVNPKGEREVLDDKARAAEAERSRSIIASDCR